MEIHIDLDPLIPKMIEGDSLRLSQILNNLVGNAVKFTEHGDIVIHAKLLELRNQVIMLQFSVSDTGIGIDQEEKSMLFHAFSQTDASNTRKYGGTGLGLAISKQLVEMMNGKIWLESIKGEGTTFYFTVQLELSEYEILKALPESFADKRFLILEDNEIEGQFIVDILESWNIHPILCSNGVEALEIAQKMPLDYMLMDWRVPGLDGFDVLERLYDGRLEVIPKVIMISALMKEDLKEKARMRKVLPHAILHKPITASLLLNALVMEETAMISIDSLSSESMEKHFTGDILMVEDNEINQLVERGLLEGYGIAVDMAVNGLDAIEKCKNKTYDLIFMDLQMPVMDGFEAAENIRLFDTKTPIIALSAAVMKHDKELTIAAGMNHHLSKPIDIEELEMVLSRYLPVVERPVTNKSVTNGPSLSFKGIDMSHLYKIYKDEEKILNYLKLFAKTQRNFCTHVEQYSIGSAEFKAAIHTFKGVSGNIAAIKLHETAVHIENSDDDDTIKALLHTLCDDLNELIVEIDQCNVSHQMHTHQFLDTADTIKLIDSTLAKLESNEFIDDDEIENLVYAVKPYLSEIVAAKLSEALNLFEFSVAIALLQTLKNDIYE
jgi:CheY-like chemotaxis protein